MSTPWLDLLSRRDIADRIAFGGRSDDDCHQSPNGHAGLRVVLDEGTWDALSLGEQLLCRRLAVFAGSFTVVGAVAVGAGTELTPEDVHSVLENLEAKALVVVDDQSVPPRYRLLETVRQFGRDQLVASKEYDVVAGHHAEWCVSAVTEAGDPRQGRGWLERLAPDHDDFDAALRWATASGRTAVALRLAPAHVLLCHARGRSSEAAVWRQRLLTRSEQVPLGVRTRARREAGLVAGMVGDFPAATACLRQSVNLARAGGDHVAAAVGLNQLGFVLMLARDYERGLEALDEGVVTARGTGDSRCRGEALAAAARAHLLVGDPRAGRHHYAEWLDVARGSQDERAAATALVGLGWAALSEGALTEATTLLAEGLEAAHELADLGTAAAALALLGEASRLEGDCALAHLHFEECAAIAWEAASPYPLGRALAGLGWLALDEGDLRTAGRRFDDALVVARQGNAPYVVPPALRGLAEVAAATNEMVAARALLEEAAAMAKGSGARAEEAAARATLTALENRTT